MMTNRKVLVAVLATAVTTATLVGLASSSLSQSDTPTCTQETAVADGEDYSSAARRAGVTPQQIQACNPWVDDISLAAGDVLRHPPGTTSPPTSTIAPAADVAVTTTVAPATPAVTTPITTPNPVTGAQYRNEFDTIEDVERLAQHVYHRNLDLYDYASYSGGSWPGDHPSIGPNGECGAPTDSRKLTLDIDDTQAERRATSIYWCDVPPVEVAANHMMTSMGNVDNYSIAAFGPDETFDSVTSVCVDVNLTDAGSRTWFKIAVVSEALAMSDVVGPTDGDAVPGFLRSDVDSADLVTSMEDDDVLFASWGGGGSGGYPNGLKIGNTKTRVKYDQGTVDVATRQEVCLTDNGDGSVTFTTGPKSATIDAVFPAGPVRVWIQHNAYTPTKVETYGHLTFHWDNLTVT